MVESSSGSNSRSGTDAGALIGAEVRTYLLEKVRLVHQATDERNYHLFYDARADELICCCCTFQIGEKRSTAI